MAFDPRSLERLRQLGRSLPQALPPPPAAGSGGSGTPAPASQRRHRLETEDNPEQLFRELMAASPDGTVPPHLLDRLRQLEAERRRPTADPAVPGPAPGPGAPRRRKAEARRQGPENDLYTAFAQLLLEEDDD